MAQEQSLQLRLRILAREEKFGMTFGAFLVSYIILGWFSPFDAKLISTRAFTSFIRLIFNIIYSVSLAAVASAIFTFDARVLGIPDIEKLNVTPLAVAGSGLVSALFLLQAILGGSSALAWFFCGFDAIVLKIALFVTMAAAAAGIYGWAFKIGRDNRQVTGLTNQKTQ